MRRFCIDGIIFGLLFVLSTAPAICADWPRFYGPNRNNCSDETGLLKQWPAKGPRLLWRKTGLGLSVSPVSISGGRIYGVGIREGQDRLFCLDERTSEELWSLVLRAEATEVPGMRSHTQRAPTIDEDRVYAISNQGDLVCADAESGTEIWRKNYESDFGGTRPVYGFTDYPLIDKHLLLCTTIGKTHSHYAINKKTGIVLWKTPVPSGERFLATTGYSAAVISEAGGLRQYVQLSGYGLRGIEAKTGRVLWTYPELANQTVNTYTPIAFEDYIVCANCYQKNGVILKIERKLDRLVPRVVHYLEGDFQYQHANLIRRGRALFAGMRNRLACFDLESGQLNWTTDAINRGSSTSTYANGHLYVLHQEGVVSLVAADPRRYQEISRFELPLEPDLRRRLTTYPVVANGCLYLRDDDELFCYEVAEEQPHQPVIATTDWPQWRGPERTNQSRESGLMTHWPDDGPPRLWSVSGLGSGISTVSVSDGLVVTLGEFDLVEYVWALSSRTGELQWVSRLGESLRQSRSMRWLTQRPPTIDQDRLYAVSLLGELVCFDLRSGRELWRYSYPRSFGGFRGLFGFSDCPIVEGDKLLCTPAGPDISVVALDKRSGKFLWRCQVPDSGVAAYSNGVIAELSGHRQFVTFLEKSIVGIDVESGKLLWRKDGSIDRTHHPHTPLVSDPYVISIDGFGGGLTVLKIDVIDSKMTVEDVLSKDIRFLAQYQDDTLLQGDYLYEVARGVLTCLNWKQGEILWQERAGSQPAITCAEGHLYLHGTDGKIQLIEYSPDGMELKSQFTLKDHQSGLGTSTPVIADKKLYIRSDDRLFCYDIADERNNSTDQKSNSVRLEVPTPDLVANQGQHDWPQWRGPNRDGISPETGLLKSWPEGGPPLEMKVEGLGAGITSVAVAGDRIYTLSDYDGDEYVLALDRTTGERLWATSIGESTQASPLMRWLSQRTPTIDGERLYAISPNGRLVCVQNTDGSLLWEKSYITDYEARQPIWGFCDYPLVDGDHLICAPGGQAASVVALKKVSGEEVWRAQLPTQPKPAHSATLKGTIGDLSFYVSFLGDGLYGLAADDGRLLWRYEGSSNRTANSHTPLLMGNQLLTTSGYGGGVSLLELNVNGQQMNIEEVYHQRTSMSPFQDNSIRVGDSAYLHHTSGSPLCMEWNTGNTLWGPIRMPRGRGGAAVTYADGFLYRRTSDGVVTLNRVSETGIETISEFQLPDVPRQSGATSPVIAGGRLYLRDNDRLFCYDIREQKVAQDPGEPKVVKLPELKNHSVTRKPRVPRPIYVPTPHDIVRQMLKEANVDKKTILVDLGSGDGRIVITAAKEHGAKAIGYEIEEELITISRESIAQQNLDKLARIEGSDMYKADLSEVDVVAVFLYPVVLDKLKPQFARLKAGARIVSHQFPIPDIKPDKDLLVTSEETGQEHRILLYTIPLKPSEEKPKE